MKAEQGKIVWHSCFIQTEKKLSGSYLVVSTHTLGPVHLRRSKGKGGREGGALLACDMYGFWCDRTFMVLLADQHWKRSCLARASTCFWTQCTENLQQVMQTVTKRSVSASIWYRRLYFNFLLVLGKHLPVKTCNMPV